MKGYRFYLEYQDPAHKRNGQDEGNVVAIIPENSWIQEGGYFVDAVGAVFFTPNSPVASTVAQWDCIHENCKRISEKRAREIHPALFEYLDYSP